MSEWYEVKDPEDIELSDDKKSVHILFDADYNGNCYVEVPVEILVKLLQEFLTKQAAVPMERK